MAMVPRNPKRTFLSESSMAMVPRNPKRKRPAFQEEPAAPAPSAAAPCSSPPPAKSNKQQKWKKKKKLKKKTMTLSVPDQNPSTIDQTLPIPAATHARSQPNIHHASVLDRVNSNWMLLQATLKKGQAASRTGNSLGKTEQRIQPAKESATLNKSQAAVLSPRNADCSLTRVLAMDCEMVGVGLDGKRSVLARVSLVNVWGNEVYDKHVRPLERVTNFRTSISGVRPRDLRKAEDFGVVQKEVAQLIFGRVLVGHAVHNDLKVMYLSHPKKDIRDTALYQPLRSKNGRPRSLRHLAADVLGVEIQEGEHCSVEDARAAMYIYQHLKKGWEGSLFRRQKSKA